MKGEGWYMRQRTDSPSALIYDGFLRKASGQGADMTNPWLKKNPFMSMWLSAANRVAGTVRGQAMAEGTRQMKAAIAEAYALPTAAPKAKAKAKPKRKP